MKVLSFDVGVKNLAYCILEYTNKKFNIEKWDVIDIINDPYSNLRCNGKKINNDLCNRKSCLFKKEDDKLVSYCKVHSRGIDNLNLIKKKKVANLSIQDMDIKLVKEMDNIDGLLNVDIVIVEQQPSKNPRMKNLSMMLHNYFIIRGIIDKDTSIKKVVFCSPKNKLKVYNGPFIECKLKGKYARTKWLGIEYCKYLIKDNNEMLNKLIVLGKDLDKYSLDTVKQFYEDASASKYKI